MDVFRLGQQVNATKVLVKFDFGLEIIHGIDSLTYDDVSAKTNVRGFGKYPTGRSDGAVNYTCQIGLHYEEVAALQRASPTGRLQDLGFFSITVTFVEGVNTVTDTLRKCEFLNTRRDINKDDEHLSSTFDIIPGFIDWAGKSLTNLVT